MTECAGGGRGIGATRLGAALLLAWMAILLAPGCSGPTVHAGVGPQGIPLPPAPAVAPRHGQDVRRLVRSRSGDGLATISADAIHIWSLPEMEFVGAITDVDYIEFARDIVLADQGRWLAVVNEYAELHIWNQETRITRRISAWQGRNVKRLVGEAPDGALLWVSMDDVLVRWDVAATEELGEAVVLDYVGQVDEAVALPDGGYLLWGTRPRRLQFEPEGGVHVEPVARFWFEELDAMLASGGPMDVELVFVDDGVPVVVDLPAKQRRRLTPRSPRVIDGAEDRATAAAVSPNGEQVVVAFASGAFEAWDLRSERQIGAAVVGPRLVREVFPRAVYDVAVAEGFVWLLLPEQKLVCFDTQDWQLAGQWEL